LIGALNQAVRVNVSNLDARELLSRISDEPQKVAFDMAAQQLLYAGVFDNTMTGEKRAQNPVTEATAALDLPCIKDQFRGPEAGLLFKALRSIR
jgi:hypothetical protein